MTDLVDGSDLRATRDRRNADKDIATFFNPGSPVDSPPSLPPPGSFWRAVGYEIPTHPPNSLETTGYIKPIGDRITRPSSPLSCGSLEA